MRATGVTRRRLGVTAKLIIPFIMIFTLGIVLLGISFIRSQNAALSRSLEQKSETLARNLAMVLSDAFATADWVHQVLKGTKATDGDIAYAQMMTPDGQVLATTDQAFEGRPLTGTAFDASALKAESFTRRDTPTADVFEVVMPVKSTQAHLGVLRIGVSTRQVRVVAWRAAWTVAVVGAVVLLVGVVTYLWLARRVVRPLNASIHRLEELASGEADLTLRLSVASTDEAGQLARALNTFLDKQHELVSDIRSASLRVGGACQQISGSAGLLAATAQEQAAALEESAASLEEITATVHQNADNASQASRLAVSARDAADKGGRVMASAVASMHDITRTSQRIGEIISVIDDIAFQTNLLALNAAVEAARAGEQGRGFAVVAAEVRNLAQRSATAAKEIKALIQDSVGKVHDGAALVDESGRTLGEIVGAVKQVTEIIAEIAAASHEQSTGIDQVNRAVSQMDQVVQQNATQTESVSSTAQALAASAAELEALVGRFKLGAQPIDDDAVLPSLGARRPDEPARHPVGVRPRQREAVLA